MISEVVTFSLLFSTIAFDIRFCDYKKPLVVSEIARTNVGLLLLLLQLVSGSLKHNFPLLPISVLGVDKVSSLIHQVGSVFWFVILPSKIDLLNVS
ncbi:hypothetical protein Bca101_014991 [Brassica carinata]